MKYLEVLGIITLMFIVVGIVLFFPSMWIAYNFGIIWMLAYLFVITSAFVAYAEAS